MEDGGHQRQVVFSEYLNYLKEKKREVEKWKTQMLERMKHPSTDILNSVDSSLRRYDQQLEEIEHRRQQASMEGTDSFFEDYFEKKKLKQEKVSVKEEQQKKLFEEQEKKQKEVLDHVYQRERKDRIYSKYNEVNMNREYEYLLRVDQSVPEYMRRNLQKMTNNKGYIWRGVHYYGHLPLPPHENPDKWVMFEKKRNELWIHETYYGHYRRTYRKLTNGGKELIQEVLYSSKK